MDDAYFSGQAVRFANASDFHEYLLCEIGTLARNAVPTRAVSLRHSLPEDARDLARLDPQAIERVRAEAALEVRDADELCDALVDLVLVQSVLNRGSDIHFERWLQIAKLRDDSQVVFLTTQRPGSDMLQAALDGPGRYLVVAPR